MYRKLIYLTCFVLVLGLVLTRAADAADPNLVGYWTFDEGSGTIASDYSGHGNDGTIEGGPQWVAGKVGGALKFDGDDDQITLKDPLTVGSSSNTVAAWVKVPLAGTERLGATERVGIVLGNYDDSPNTNWELHAVGQMRLYWNAGQISRYGTTIGGARPTSTVFWTMFRSTAERCHRMNLERLRKAYTLKRRFPPIRLMVQ